MAIGQAMPIVESVAAKRQALDGGQRACWGYMGPAGADHYVKMVHNGIENGMLGAVCQSWALGM